MTLDRGQVEQSQLDQLIAQMSAMSVAQQELTRAIIGDEKVGHLGLIKRVSQLEAHVNERPTLLASLETSRVEGDKRTHSHIESVEDALTAKITAFEHEADDRADRIERKIDRFIWLSVGGAMATFGAGWVLGANVPMP